MRRKRIVFSGVTFNLLFTLLTNFFPRYLFDLVNVKFLFFFFFFFFFS